MISYAPVLAVVMRHIRLWKRDPNVLIASLYWPILDILIWGFLGKWIAQTQGNNLPAYETVALLGVLLWQIVGRGCAALGLSFYEELWSGNIVNLFSLPLRLAEWIVGVILLYAIMMTLVASSSLLVICTLYDVSLWYIVPTFLLFMPPLFLSGLWLGFICLQIAVILGRRGSELVFVVGWFFMPFCGAYYPIEVLPSWAQMISNWIPMSFIFQGMREYVMYQQDPTPYLLKAYVLSIIYASCAALVFIYCFNRSKRKGLARLTN